MDEDCQQQVPSVALCLCQLTTPTGSETVVCTVDIDNSCGLMLTLNTRPY